ncbi:hypothetical protein [Mycoplasma wenyonii]|uniref:hypothetical protein n=1 Tax=Mycoplasma wenyonii TaxID=65123 RepID=UPI0021ABFF97|nr:hypothetical protein [Mycoplasma wenyonii]
MASKEIKDVMSKFGTYSCFTQEYKKFKASRLQKNETTIEYLHCLVKDDLSKTQ